MNTVEKVDYFKMARERVDLAAFVESCYGRPRFVGGSVRWQICPHCGDGGAGSVRLSIKRGENKYHCFACAEGGGIVDFASVYLGVDPLEAAKMLVGGDVQFKERDLEQEKKARAAEEDKELARAQIVQRLNEELHGRFINVDGMKYFALTRMIGKKVMLEALERRILAFLPNTHDEAAGVLKEICGMDLLERAESVGRTGKIRIAERPAVFFTHKGESAEFRLTRPATDKFELKAIRHGGGNHPWFWEGTNPENKVCVVTEGVVDMLSQVAMNWDGHVLGCPSANSYRRYWFSNLHKTGAVSSFVNRFDNDEVKNPHAQTHAGNVWSQTMLEQWKEDGVPGIVKLPVVGDINEQLCLWRQKQTPS